MNKFNNLYNLVMEGLDNKSDDIINDIIKKLNSSELFDQNEHIKNKIIKYLNILKNDDERNFENFNKLLSLLRKDPSNNGPGLNKEQSKELARELEEKFDTKTIKSLINYLNNRSLIIDDYCDGKKRSFADLFNAANLTNEQDALISYLNNKQFHSLPSIGKGELLFSIIFSNAHRPRGKKQGETGDVIVNNENLEIKGNKARLGGQSGYGKGFSASKFIKTKFIKLNNNDKEIANKINNLDNIDFNFDNERINSTTNSFLALCNLTAKNNSSFDLENAKEIMKDAFKQIFVNEDVFNEALKISDFTDYLVTTESLNNEEHNFENIKSYKELKEESSKLKKEIEAIKISVASNEEKQRKKDLQLKKNELDKKIDQLRNTLSTSTKFKIDNSNDQFSNSLLIFSLKYYNLVDGFSYFALTNGNEFIVLDSEQINDKDSVTKSIHVASGLSFADNAGEQGGKISIILK